MCLKEQERLKALTATLERLGISLNKNSRMTQASNLIIVVSTKTLYLMLFVWLEIWRTGDKLVPTSAGVESSQESFGSWCLQQPHFHAVHRRRCCFFSFLSPLFSFLPLSLLIPEANGCSELRGGFIAQLHDGGAWFSLCSAGYQF